MPKYDPLHIYLDLYPHHWCCCCCCHHCCSHLRDEDRLLRICCDDGGGDGGGGDVLRRLLKWAYQKTLRHMKYRFSHSFSISDCPLEFCQNFFWIFSHENVYYVILLSTHSSHSFPPDHELGVCLVGSVASCIFHISPYQFETAVDQSPGGCKRSEIPHRVSPEISGLYGQKVGGHYRHQQANRPTGQTL